MAAKIGKALQEIIDMDEAYLTPAQVGKVLGCNGYNINVASKTPEGAAALGFPVLRIGNRCKVPRIPFLAYMGVEVEA